MAAKMDEAAKRRVHAARLRPTGEKPAKVAELVGAPRQTVYRWLDVLREGGIEALLAGPTANGYATDLWTLKRVRLLIEKRFAVSYSDVHVWRMLGASSTCGRD